MVMNKGVAEQIGTPVEVYETGQSLRGELYRQPGDEPVDGVISASGDRFELPGGLAADCVGHRGHAGRNMTLGIRPEHIALSSQAKAACR